jgi:hypothetical protein
VRRTVQDELPGHRGRKDDPLYKIRRVLLTVTARLNGRGVDPMALTLRLGDRDDEVLGAWLAEEYVRDVYLTEILTHRLAGASHGSTEAMNLLVEKIKRCGHGFKSSHNYRRPVLLHSGGINCDAHPAARMRARSPQLAA